MGEAGDEERKVESEGAGDEAGEAAADTHASGPCEWASNPALASVLDGLGLKSSVVEGEWVFIEKKKFDLWKTDKGRNT